MPIATLTFLGTSAGVPSVQRGMPAIALRWNDLFLFDCGEGTQREMMRYRLGYGSVKAVFISHPHLDHFVGLFGLVETLRMSGMRGKLVVFAPKGFLEMFPGRMDIVDIKEIAPGLLYEDKDFTIAAYKTRHIKNSFGFIIQEKDRVKFDEKKAHALGLHGRLFQEIEKKGFVIAGKKKIKLEDVSWIRKGRKIVYSGDCAPCEETINAARDADILIHEGTFAKEMENEARERAHSTVVDAAEIAKKAGVKRLIITHISARYKDAEGLRKQAKEVFPNSEIAEDGMTIEI